MMYRTIDSSVYEAPPMPTTSRTTVSTRPGGDSGLSSPPPTVVITVMVM
jgi:hypothetical protein